MELSEKAIKVLGSLQKLNALDITSAVTSKEVAEKSFLLPKSTTGVINSLVNKELVGKTNDTPRKYIITPTGLDMLKD